MKKIYLEPTTDVVKLDYTNALLSGSIGAEGGGSDGGASVTPTDPSEEGWGDDY